MLSVKSPFGGWPAVLCANAFRRSGEVGLVLQPSYSAAYAGDNGLSRRVRAPRSRARSRPSHCAARRTAARRAGVVSGRLTWPPDQAVPIAPPLGRSGGSVVGAHGASERRVNGVAAVNSSEQSTQRRLERALAQTPASASFDRLRGRSGAGSAPPGRREPGARASPTRCTTAYVRLRPARRIRAPTEAVRPPLIERTPVASSPCGAQARRAGRRPRGALRRAMRGSGDRPDEGPAPSARDRCARSWAIVVGGSRCAVFPGHGDLELGGDLEQQVLAAVAARRAARRSAARSRCRPSGRLIAG